MSRRAQSLFGALLLAALTPRAARADALSVFGAGARSAGLARATVAGGGPADAPRDNAALAAEPGLHMRLGYGGGAMLLTINGDSAGVPRASGFNLSAQAGVEPARKVAIGAALSLYMPDQYIAGIRFRPATEPQFALYEAPLQRTAVDIVVAARFGPIAIGGGVASILNIGGKGTRFELGQDAGGPFADAGLDIALPYRFAPIAGIHADFGRVAVGASVRGALAIDLRLDSDIKVTLHDNPLGGTTTVHVNGPSGFDPAVIAAGARVDIGGGLSALASFEYAVYSAVPPPVADVVLDVKLGTTPSQREVRFPLPRFRDTISPRFGVELRRPAGPSSTWRWAARAGYALSPSPVPPQTGLTTYADATRHQIALGGGYHIGRVIAVDLAVNAAAQLHLLNPRALDKANASLPYSHVDVGGKIVYGAATLEATWR